MFVDITKTFMKTRQHMHELSSYYPNNTIYRIDKLSHSVVMCLHICLHEDHVKSIVSYIYR